MHVRIQSIIHYLIQVAYVQCTATRLEVSKGFEAIPLRMVYRVRSIIGNVSNLSVILVNSRDDALTIKNSSCLATMCLMKSGTA